MPANPKHLTASPVQRFAKISAGILGGYLVSIALHLALASWFNHVNVLITSAFSAMTIWVILMMLAFLARNGWKIWGLYLFITLLFTIVIWLGRNYNPDFLSHG